MSNSPKLSTLVQAARLVTFARRFGPIGWIVFGLLLALGAAGYLRADYVVDRYTGTLTNTTAQMQVKRVTLYEVDEVEGDEVTVHRVGATTASYSDGAIRRIDIEVTDPITNALIERIFVMNTAAGVPNTVNVPQTDRPSAWRREIGVYSTVTLTRVTNIGSPVYSAPVTTTGEPTIGRGAVIGTPKEFTVGPNESIALVLEHTGPFFVGIEDMKMIQTGDGGGAIVWEEVDDGMSTEVTEVSEETEAPDPTTAGTPSGPQFTSGPDLDPAERPETVTTTQDLNDAQEARHTDETGVLKQIKAGVDASANLLSNIAGGGKVSESTAASETAIDGYKEGVGGTLERMDDVIDAGADLLGAISLGLPSGDPTFYYEIDPPWTTRNFVLESNATMDAGMSIVRALIAAALSFGAIMAAIRIIRGAFA